MTKIKPPVDSRFNANHAIELADLIEKAYQQFDYSKENKIWEPEKSKKLIINAPDKKDLLEYEVLTIFKVLEFTFTSVEEVPFGFIAQRTLEDGNPGIFIVFRGTLTTDEWYHNSRFKQVYFLEDKELGEVSEGFNTVYTRSVDKDYIRNIAKKTLEIISNELLNRYEVEHIIGPRSLEYAVRETIKGCPDNSQIFVTGHSLGGALATLATAHIVTRCMAGRPALKKPILYTYASPRVGDPNFASHFQELECYRIANSEDVVVSVPPSTGKISGPERKDASNTSRENIKQVTDEFVKNSSNYVYQHVGEPIYFTNQSGFVSSNHNMVNIYRGALSEPG